MVFRRTYDTDPGDAVVERRYDDVEEGPVVGATPWSPAQIIGLIAGIGFVVLGIAAVVRTGFDTSHIYSPHMTIWHLPHSPLLAVCEIAWGALMIIASVVPGGVRTLMGLLGVVMLVLGLVILIGSTPARLAHWLGVHHSNGWLFTIVGAVVVLASIVSPVFFGGTRHRRVRHVRQLA